jgi:hypothetical protein
VVAGVAGVAPVQQTTKQEEVVGALMEEMVLPKTEKTTLAVEVKAVTVVLVAHIVRETTEVMAELP